MVIGPRSTLRTIGLSETRRSTDQIGLPLRQAPQKPLLLSEGRNRAGRTAKRNNRNYGFTTGHSIPSARYATARPPGSSLTLAHPLQVAALGGGLSPCDLLALTLLVI